MRKKYLKIEVSRDGYAEEQVVDSAITIKELIDILSRYDEDLLVITSHDNGYTYGTINDWDIETAYFEEDEEDEDFEDEDEV